MNSNSDNSLQFSDPAERLADSLLSEHARLRSKDDEALLEEIFAATIDRTSEPLTDSLLREHARLGTEEDTTLVNAIIANTTAATPADTAPIVPAQPRFGALNWTVVVGSAAAAVGLCLLALNQFSFETKESRHSDTFHFVVKTVEPASSEQVKVKTKKPLQAGAHRPFQGELTPVSGDSEALASVELKQDNLASVSDFSPKPSELPNRATRMESVTISADNTSHRGEHMNYTGNVLMVHEEFTLAARELEVSVDKSTGILTAKGQSEITLRNGEVVTIDPKKEQLILTGAEFEIRELPLEIFARPAGETR